MQTKYFAAFDFAESRWRWDVEESTGPLQAKYLESDGVSYFYNADAHSLEKNLPGRDLGLRECGPLDPRLVGLTGAGDLHAHAPYGRIKEIINGFSNGTTKELEDGKVELLYEVGPMSDHWLNLQVYVIDVERLVPLVLETRLRRSDVDVDQSVVLERSTTKWKEMGGALVPVEFETRYMEMGDGNVSSTTRYEFNWESVNEPVPSRRFDYRDFGPFPEGTAIVDTRLGKPVILEIVGHTAGVANTPMPIPQESHVVAWITAAAALALLGVIAAALLARRKRRLGAID
ncbi:MAG: hypothetical protein O3C40_18755 [Planctomycetota bacterium]|nr:hypothetical protein [Planctomycetota bacterium]